MKNIHPGEVLSEEFLIPINITAYKLAKDIGISQTRISEIIKFNRKFNYTNVGNIRKKNVDGLYKF